MRIQSDSYANVKGDMDRLHFHEYSRARLTHYLFRFPAKFHPPVARKLIEEFSKEGELILDPFCGSGTLLIEANLVGRRTIGMDIDPVAVFVSRVKTLSISAKTLRRSSCKLLNLLRMLERPESTYDRMKFGDISIAAFERELFARNLVLPQIPNFSHWFRRYVAVDLAEIQSQIDCVDVPENHRLFLQLIFASIIRKASNADPVPVSGLEVTSHMRRLEAKGRYINPFRLFRRALSQSLKDWDEYQRRRSGASSIEIKQADAMQIRRYLRRKVDVIITSPPYHQAVDYYRRHTLEMYWLRLVNNQSERLLLRKQYIGRHGIAKSDPIARRRSLTSPLAQQWEVKLRDRSEARAIDFRHYICAMTKCIYGMASALRQGGRAVFVLGKNTTSGGLEIPSTEIFDEIASSRLQLCTRYWYPVRNRYMTYSRRNGANIDKEYVLVYKKQDS